MLSDLLKKEGFIPWMDDQNIHPGDTWEDKIREAIKSSDYFLVIITPNSKKNDGYLQKEISLALDIHKELKNDDRFIIPLRLKDCNLPERLSFLQSADMFNPDGYDRLLKILHKPKHESIIKYQRYSEVIKNRIFNLPIGGIKTPCFFPAISGVSKNNLTPLDHLRIVSSLEFPQFLISAYDIHNSEKKIKNEILNLLNNACSNNQIVLLDSGLYEKKWLKDETWCSDNFHNALKDTPCHMSFCYDNPEPTGNIESITENILNNISSDRELTNMNLMMPIIHAQRPGDFPIICEHLVKKIKPIMIVIPERELGNGILEGVDTIIQIRKVLKETENYYPIHLLGTGNPLSILLYSAFGVDSFDGLDWCQTTVDHETGKLYHSLHLDFFEKQSSFGKDNIFSYHTKLFTHNLLFYEKWMRQIREHLIENKVHTMFEKFLPPDILPKLKSLQN